MNAVPDAKVKALASEYEQRYAVAPELRKSGARHELLLYGARLELGMRAFLEDGGFKGFTTTFEDLHGLRQLPGLAPQRLMADGLRLRRRGRLEDRRTRARDEGHGRRAAGRDFVHGGLHLSSGAGRPSGARLAHARDLPDDRGGQAQGSRFIRFRIGGKEDPVRLVFDAATGPALNASLIDLGSRFRLLVNEVTSVDHPALPKLPVARAVWECKPDFKTACAAWILAGGAHHTGYSYSVTREMLEDFATIAGIEMAVIGPETTSLELQAGPAQQRRLLLPCAGIPRLSRNEAMFKELKREAYEANVALPRHGLINLTFGNASAIDRARAVFAIKPSGVDYTALAPEDMVVIDLEGRRVEGKLNPSSDTPTHRRLFLAFPNIGGVVHTHSSHATAFAQAGRPIPIFGTTHADYFNGEVPVTRKMRPSEIATDYEWETGNVIVETMRNRDPADFPGVLVNRHAPFTWGASVAKALENAVAVECIAQMALMSLQLAPNLEPIEEELLNKHFKRKHGAGAYYGQTPDF